MKMKMQEKGTVAIVALEGNIMQEDVAIFRNRLDDLMHNGKIEVVLDLNGVSYLSSMCLAVIIDIKNQLVAQRGDLKLASVNYLIKNLFEVTRLIRKIDIYATVDEAVSAYS